MGTRNWSVDKVRAHPHGEFDPYLGRFLHKLFRAEVADVLSQVLLLALHHGIDVVEEVRRKWLDGGDR